MSEQVDQRSFREHDGGSATRNFDGPAARQSGSTRRWRAPATCRSRGGPLLPARAWPESLTRSCPPKICCSTANGSHTESAQLSRIARGHDAHDGDRLPVDEQSCADDVRVGPVLRPPRPRQSPPRLTRRIRALIGAKNAPAQRPFRPVDVKEITGDEQRYVVRSGAVARLATVTPAGAQAAISSSERVCDRNDLKTSTLRVRQPGPGRSVRTRCSTPTCTNASGLCSTRGRNSTPSIRLKTPASRPIPSARVSTIAPDRMGVVRRSRKAEADVLKHHGRVRLKPDAMLPSQRRAGRARDRLPVLHQILRRSATRAPAAVRRRVVRAARAHHRRAQHAQIRRPRARSPSG